MKKTLLLAGVACLVSVNAHAFDMNNLVKPYIGVDYVYTNADYKNLARKPKESYNSGAINVGTQIGRYTGLEAFFQQSGKRKQAKGTPEQIRTEFYDYGLDLYGYMPIGCDGFNLVGALGVANYNVKAKFIDGSIDKQRVGYRAAAGVQYDFTEHFAARVLGRYDYIGMKYLDNLWEVVAGLRYTF